MRFPIFYDTVSGGGITVIVPRIMPICDDKSEVGCDNKFKQNEEYYKADRSTYQYWMYMGCGTGEQSNEPLCRMYDKTTTRTEGQTF